MVPAIGCSDRRATSRLAYAQVWPGHAKAPATFLTTAEGLGFEPRETRKPQRFSRPPHSTALPPLRGNKHRTLARARHGLARSRASGRVAVTVQPKERQRSDVGARCDTSRTTSTSRDRFREAAHRRPAMIAATLSWSAGYAQSCRSMSNGKSPTPSTAYAKRSAMPASPLRPRCRSGAWSDAAPTDPDEQRSMTRGRNHSWNLLCSSEFNSH